MKSVGIDLGMVPRKNNDSALSIKKNSVNLKKNNIKVYKQSQTVDDKSLLSVNSSSSKSLISNNIYKMSHEDVIDLTPTESMVELSEDSFRPKTPDSVNVIEGIATQQRSLSDAEVKDVISDINEMCDERPNCTTRKTTSKNV